MITQHHIDTDFSPAIYPSVVPQDRRCSLLAHLISIT